MVYSMVLALDIRRDSIAGEGLGYRFCSVAAC
jgi:hypothetical protein